MAGALACACNSLVAAQASVPPMPPVVPPAAPATGAPSAPPAAQDDAVRDRPKSLDDVLGIPGSGGAEGRQGSGDDSAPAQDKASDRVDQALDEKAIEDLMHQALGSMRVSAERLGKETDVGIGTQRVQQDVIAKLDALIEEAKKRCKGGKCGGSSSSCQNPGEQKDGDGKPGESQKSNESRSRKDAGKAAARASGSDAAGAEPPPIDPTDEGTLLDESRAEWGNLPERVRDLIRQGSRDRIAALYQRLTEEYYRRMAEDASK